MTMNFRKLKVAAPQLQIARSVFSQNIFMKYVNPHIKYKLIKKLKVKLAFTMTSTLNMLRYCRCYDLYTDMVRTLFLERSGSYVS